MVSFVDIHFDPEEENIPNHLHMFAKQFKTLNKKLNSLLQFIADARIRNHVSGIEIDVVLTAQELHLKNMMDQMDKNNELQIKSQTDPFNHVVKELKSVAKEWYILFIQDVKKVCEDVNLKIEELRSELVKEVAALDKNYPSLQTKVDIIVDAMTNVVKWYNSLIPKFDSKVESVAQEVAKL